MHMRGNSFLVLNRIVLFEQMIDCWYTGCLWSVCLWTITECSPGSLSGSIVVDCGLTPAKSWLASAQLLNWSCNMKHSRQVRARLQVAGMLSQWLEQALQKMRPHQRQWWRRMKSVKVVRQPWHCCTVSSGVHLSLACTRCMYNNRSLCCHSQSFSLRKYQDLNLA